ncbi:MAG: nuclear transport factor 2 family protein [Alphaproteobacteria bacterium]
MKIVIASDRRERSNPDRDNVLDRHGRSRGLAMTALIASLSLAACNQQSPTTMRGPVAEDYSAQAVQEILAADRAFNDEAKAKGAGQAFADFMDDKDGMLIQGGTEPVRGRDAIFRAQNDNLVPSPLVWSPDEAFAGKSGDLGASWGHWKYTRPDGSTATGKYLTVWRKNADGKWKGLMDTGVSDPPARPVAPVTPPAGQALPQSPPEIVQPPGPNQPSAHP